MAQAFLLKIMAHLRLLFIGGRDNLDQIFANCQDSSSETAAEMTIGADWISDYDWLDEEEMQKGWTTDNFTKDNEELYKQVIEGHWAYCYDIRNINNYGSFDCLNCPNFEEYVSGGNWREIEKRNKERTIAFIKGLPADTIFHFAESHW